MKNSGKAQNIKISLKRNRNSNIPLSSLLPSISYSTRTWSPGLRVHLHMRDSSEDIAS